MKQKIEELTYNRTKEEADQLARIALSNDEKFNELISVFLNDSARIVQTASWVLNKCFDIDKTCILPFLDRIIQYLENTKDDAVRRNICRLLQDTELPEEFEGKVFDICLRFMKSIEEPIAVRVFSMTVVANLALKYPDLLPEILPTIEMLNKTSESGAIISRSKRELKRLSKIM